MTASYCVNSKNEGYINPKMDYKQFEELTNQKREEYCPRFGDTAISIH